MATLRELRDERLRKIQALHELGIDPYPAKSRRTHTTKEVTEQFTRLKGKTVSVTGRLTNTRKFGKIAFFVMKDASGNIQLFLKRGVLNPLEVSASQLGYEQLNLLDPGDFIEATGKVIETETGEISIEVKTLRILTKSLRPLPTPQEGFTDKEQRLRRRYVDTNVNPDVYQRFIRRSQFWQAHRDFLNKRGFYEINLPILEHVTGGADANPFVTHMDALDQDFFLRISHELYIKRLIGGGYERVYDIGTRFRNENYSDEHLPEHVAMEFNCAYMSYEEGMDLAEELMKYVAETAFGTLKFKIGEFTVDLDQKWPRVEYAKLMRDKMDVDVFSPDIKQLKNILRKHKAYVTDEMNELRAMDGVWKIIRAQEAGPFWLVHEPTEISPLSKAYKEDPRISERVHPVIAGTEAGNGYSELNDPIDQLQRMLAQQALRDAGDKEAQMLDIDFIEMMEYGMPPNFGWGHSERYFWMLEGVSAREGVPFPQLRHEIDDVTKAIYPQVYSKKPTPRLGQTLRKQDFSHKIIAVVDKKLEPWKVTNAVAHMSAIIGNELDKDKLTSGEVFVGSDGVSIPRNSQYPIIIKKAREIDLHSLFEKVIEKRLVYHVFIKEMQETTNDDEIVSKLKTQPIQKTTFYGLAFFASNELADSITKKFQLWE